MAQRTRSRPASTTNAAKPTGTDVVADAFIFGYPMILMDATRRLSTACAAPAATRAPTNRFAHLRMFPDATFTDIVSPNVDTLYSIAWLELSAEPSCSAYRRWGRATTSCPCSTRGRTCSQARERARPATA